MTSTPTVAKHTSSVRHYKEKGSCFGDTTHKARALARLTLRYLPAGKEGSPLNPPATDFLADRKRQFVLFRLPARNVIADATTLPSPCLTPWTWILLVLRSAAHAPFA